MKIFGKEGGQIMRKSIRRKALSRAAIFATSMAIAFAVSANADPDSQPAAKQYPPGTRSLAVSGSGSDTCAAWTQSREGTSEEAKQDAQKRTEWVLGFLTAINMFNTPSGSLHGGIDSRDGALSWIDARCKVTPTNPLFAAVAELVFDLRNHPRP